MFRSCSAVGRDRHSCVLESSVRLSGFVGSLRVFAFLCGDPDGVTGDAGDEKRGYEGTGLAARPLCVFAQPHWHCEFFRGENAGAARPRLRQRVFDSLDSLHLGRGVGAFHAGRGVRGQRRLERLALVLRLSYVPIGMSYARSRLLFAA